MSSEVSMFIMFCDFSRMVSMACSFSGWTTGRSILADSAAAAAIYDASSPPAPFDLSNISVSSPLPPDGCHAAALESYLGLCVNSIRYLLSLST